MKRILLVLAVLGFITVINAQGTPTPEKFTFNGGMLYGVKWSDVDSTETVYSQWFDASLFDGQDYISCWIVVDGTGSVDSLTLVTIEGRYPPLTGDAGTSYVTGFVIDTIATNKVTGIQTILGTSYNQTVQRGVLNDTVFVQKFAPPVRTFPQWRFKVVGGDLTVSGYDMVVRAYLYAKFADAGLRTEDWK